MNPIARRLIATLCLLLSLTPALAADARLMITMMPKAKGNAYFISCKAGADRAARELGVELLFDGPTDSNAAKQNEIVENWITLGVVLSVVIAVLFARANIGMAGFVGAVVLAVLRVADHEQAIRRMPWAVIVMVSGVTVLISLLEKTGGKSGHWKR